MYTTILKKTILAMSSLVFICSSGLASAVPTNTAKGKIKLYTSGWGENTVRVETTAPFTGQPCATRTDGYHTDPAQPANAAHQAALLMAFQTNKSVSFTLDGCIYGSPKIIGVYVTNN